MRILSFIPALAALVTAVASVAVPDTCTGSEMKCVSGVGPKRELTQHPSRNLRAMTNAELLRRGLPLNRPVLRRGTPVRRTDPSSVPDEPVQVVHTGIIEVLDAESDELLGYVARELSYGVEFAYDPSISNALHITFQTDGTGDGTQLDIGTLDSIPDWPLFGLIQGRNDIDSNLSPGSYQYLYFGGVANPGTQPGDPPTLIENSYSLGPPRTAETAVWTYTSSTGRLTPKWVNTDGTYPELQAWTQDNGIYLGGNPAQVTLIKFVFVPQ